MFSGVACFSPQVDLRIRQLWQENGGTVATSLDDLEFVSFFFATADDQYWITSLKMLSVPVYNQAWVLDSVREGKRTAFPHRYRLSDVLPLEHARSTEPTTEVTMTCSPGSNGTNEDTLKGDETDSDLEVERTLVDDQEIQDACQTIIQARYLLALFYPLCELPEISLVDLAELAPIVYCVRFRSGGAVDGVPFRTERKMASVVHLEDDETGL